MKNLLMVSAAALSLAACDTLGYGPSYPPGPAPGPYPADPNAPGTAYPAPSAYPPNPYSADPRQACPIASSRDWKAWVNAMPGPGARPKLVVTGKIVTASAGYRIGFDPRLQVRRTYPPQAFATLQVTPPPGAASQLLYSQDVHWEWPLSQPLGSVEIRCGSETLAHIEPVATAQ